jgi:two-component system chemotaxis response regulator CheB
MKHDLVVIGSSYGGIETLGEILFKIPDDFGVPILVTTHFTEKFDRQWVKDANYKSQMDLHWVQGEQIIERGNIYIAPPDRHLIVQGRRRVHLSDAPPIQTCRPAIDPMFESAAEVIKSGLLGIVLTGMNTDGTYGTQKIVEYGGTVIVQDPETAKSPTMPASAMKYTKKELILSPKDIHRFLVRFNRL